MWPEPRNHSSWREVEASWSSKEGVTVALAAVGWAKDSRGLARAVRPEAWAMPVAAYWRAMAGWQRAQGALPVSGKAGREDARRRRKRAVIGNFIF